MGEFREKLTLINATDEAMVRRGHLTRSGIRRVSADAVVNTEFVRSVIPTRIAEELGVEVRNGIATTPIVFECLGEAVIGDGIMIIGRSVADKLRNPGRIKPRFVETTE